MPLFLFAVIFIVENLWLIRLCNMNITEKYCGWIDNCYMPDNVLSNYELERTRERLNRKNSKF